MADRRRWWPLAAAATVAAIAVGVLQLTPPDQIGAPAADKTIVTDVPAPASRPAPEMPATPSRPEEPKPEAGNALRAEQAPTRADSPRRQAPAPSARAASRRRPQRIAMAEPFRRHRRTPASPRRPRPPAASAAAPDARCPAAPRARRRRRDRRRGAPPPSRDAVAPRSTPPLRTGAGRAAPRARQRKRLGAAGAAREDGRRACRRCPRRRGAGQGPAPLPVPEWIALIRRLRDEGKSADAAKELAAFRVAHADHEKLLPPDLRDWRPPEKLGQPTASNSKTRDLSPHRFRAPPAAS